MSRRLAKDRQLALRPLGLCRSDRTVGGYPRDGVLSFFHGPSHIGHQSFEIVLGSLKLCPVRLHSMSPFALEGRATPPISGRKLTVSCLGRSDARAFALSRRETVGGVTTGHVRGHGCAICSAAQADASSTMNADLLPNDVPLRSWSSNGTDGVSSTMWRIALRFSRKAPLKWVDDLQLILAPGSTRCRG